MRRALGTINLHCKTKHNHLMLILMTSLLPGVSLVSLQYCIAEILFGMIFEHELATIV
jgi:hypothetical protein